MDRFGALEDESVMPEADQLHYPDELIRGILDETRTIAMVGASDNPVRPSFIAFKYLRQRGFDVLPINPSLAGRTILGIRVHARLADVPVGIDMVDIFRNSNAAGLVVDEALALSPRPKTIWMQLSVRDDAAAARAVAAGVKVVMDRCPKIGYCPRLPPGVLIRGRECPNSF